MCNCFVSQIRTGCSFKRRNPNKIWVDQCSKFKNQLFKNYLRNNNTAKHSPYNEKKSIFAERFIRTLKNKIQQHITVISGDRYFDFLDDIVNKYSNTVHTTIKIKPIDVRSNSYAEYNVHSNEKDPKFKVGDRVRKSKYKSSFTSGYTQIQSEQVFVASKARNTFSWTYLISDLNGGKLMELFMNKNCKNKSKIIQNRKDS